MANIKKIQVNSFNFQPFSEKQLKLLTWWTEESPYRDAFICFADGAVRSGKSIVAILSFVTYIMSHFNYQNCSLCGKSIMSVRRNIVQPLKQICLTTGIEVIDHRSDNFLELHQGDVCNIVYLFGGRDESSQDLVK